MFFEEASAYANIENTRSTKFIKTLVIRSHRQENKVTTLQQHPLAVDFLIVTTGQNNGEFVVIMLVQATDAFRFIVDNHVKILAIKQLLLKCGFNFHRVYLLRPDLFHLLVKLD
ncbi:hypothetical protein D3C78_1323610 [compost metagenome]